MIQDIGPHRLRNEFHPGRTPEADSLIVAFSIGKLLSCAEGEFSVPDHEELKSLMTPEEPAPDDLVWLFTMDGKDCFWYKRELVQALSGGDGKANAPVKCPSSGRMFGYYSLRDLRKEGLGLIKDEA